VPHGSAAVRPILASLTPAPFGCAFLPYAHIFAWKVVQDDVSLLRGERYRPGWCGLQRPADDLAGLRIMAAYSPVQVIPETVFLGPDRTTIRTGTVPDLPTPR